MAKDKNKSLIFINRSIDMIDSNTCSFLPVAVEDILLVVCGDVFVSAVLGAVELVAEGAGVAGPVKQVVALDVVQHATLAPDHLWNEAAIRC